MNQFFCSIALGMVILTLVLFISPCPASSVENNPPNVLFIAIDDLNDWTGCLAGHPQVITPNIDRLANRGVLFNNAHCQAPICMPSRTSLLTSTYPWQNGVYMIEQEFRTAPVLKNAVTLPQYFRKNGYRTLGVGKIYHRREGDPDAWDEWGGALRLELDGQSGWSGWRERLAKT